MAQSELLCLFDEDKERIHTQIVTPTRRIFNMICMNMQMATVEMKTSVSFCYDRGVIYETPTP